MTPSEAGVQVVLEPGQRPRAEKPGDTGWLRERINRACHENEGRGPVGAPITGEESCRRKGGHASLAKCNDSQSWRQAYDRVQDARNIVFKAKRAVLSRDMADVEPVCHVNLE